MALTRIQILASPFRCRLSLHSHAPTLRRSLSTTIDLTSLKGRSLGSLFDLSPAECRSLLDAAALLNRRMGRERVVYQPLVGAGGQ